MALLTGRTPWWGIVAAKLVLSRLPVSHRVWKRLGLFKHGAMEEPSYAYDVFMKHFRRVRPRLPSRAFVCLELGPGESLSSAVVAKALGSSLTYLVDVGPYATPDLRVYRNMAAFLVGAGLTPPNLDVAESFEGVLDACHAIYKTSGVESLREIPSGTVDYVWSHAVLQHVKRAELLPMLRELHRIIRGNGVCSHVIDLRDCIAGGLNHLRFDEELWEKPVLSQSGLYTNRMRFAELMAAFREAEFDVEVAHLARWEALPIARGKLSEPFRLLSDEELRISGCELLLRPM
jgi:SAM-dependent methyltransferase